MASSAPKRPVNASMLQTRGSKDLVFREILEAHRDDLSDALELEASEFAAKCNPDDDPGLSPAAVMLSMMQSGEPHFTQMSLTEMMKQAGLNKLDIMNLMRKKDLAYAMFLSSRHLGQVLDDIGEDAKSTIISCKNCGGDGKSPDAKAAVAELAHQGIEIDEENIEACEDCSGVGKLRKIGDPDSRKMFLEMHGIRKTGGGAGAGLNLNVGVQVNNQQKEEKAPVTLTVQKLLDGG